MSRFKVNALPRLLSTSAITPRPPPSKSHHHAPIPSTAFPHGYLLTGIHCGIKKNPSIPDLALILSTSPYPTSAAACFTKNAFKAAPVQVSSEVLLKNVGRARAIIVNSGCANAVTGKQGLEDAWRMVRETTKLLPAPINERGEDALVMSTGVIGQQLPIDKVVRGITEAKNTLGNDFAAWERAAKAFMTTDTFPKLRARTFTVNGVEYRIAGIDKGAGMIHPDMAPAMTFAGKGLHATLLACILTDFPISPPSLQSALTYAIARSFNSISVDGEMSTNDTVLAFANAAAPGTTIDPSTNRPREIELESKAQEDREAYDIFRNELTEFAIDLAKLVVRDGEGATKFVTITVKGAPTYEDAHAVASRISTSALVKTALYGEDANWGRILAATGSVPLSGSTSSASMIQAPTKIDPTRVSVTFVPVSPNTTTSSARHSFNPAPLPVLVNGEPEIVDEVRAKEILSEEEFEIVIDLGIEGGHEGARYWTCDLSYEYVRINGDYRS